MAAEEGHSGACNYAGGDIAKAAEVKGLPTDPVWRFSPPWEPGVDGDGNPRRGEWLREPERGR